jgi:predicted phage terminase large subunit-like protein
MTAPQVSIKWSKYIPQVPSDCQAKFLALPCREAFYGGAAGGGKSSALLMAALQYADVPGYAALILRRTYADLSLPGALLDRAREWLTPTDAVPVDGGKSWRFPSGATLTFGYLDTEAAKFRYKSAEFQFVAFDELTQFTETQYTYLFSRLRRLKTASVPVRMRSGSNPGDVGHEWVRERFVAPETANPKRVFVPAKLTDNPHLDAADYLEGLDELDPITRQQLRDGDWSARQAGGLFDRMWFEVVDEVPDGLRCCRYWDLAATEKHDHNDPDATAGCLLGERDGTLYILDMRRDWLNPGNVDRLVKATAQQDGVAVPICMEQEPGASGKRDIANWSKELLGYNYRAFPASADKLTRARPVSAAAYNGRIKVRRAPWNRAFFDELEAFKGDGKQHDDQVDALSGAYGLLNQPVGRAYVL